MFQGATALSLDVKGRLAIPARHREALVQASGGELVLTAHPHRCLLLYPAPAGRLLIAPELRQFAQLEKTVYMVGQGSHFEIWSEAGWQQQQDIFSAMGDTQLPPGLEDLAL